MSVSDTTIETWQEILEKVPYDSCHKAYIDYLKSGEYREPKPGDILSLARSWYQKVHVNNVECEICHGRGMLVLVEPDGHESVGRCSCENGMKFPGFPIVKLEYYHYNQAGRVEIRGGA